MEFSIQKFNETKEKAEIFYSSVGKVFCPYFQDFVHFNAKGFEHLIFKEWNKARSIKDQFTRLRFIKLAPAIVEQSKTVQGLWTTQKIERTKKNHRWEKVMMGVTYYEFIAVVDMGESKVRVKVIVKQVSGGERFFLSIIPFWGVNKISGQRVLHSGNPERD